MKFAFELQDLEKTSLEFANKINGYDLKITSNYNLFSDIPDYGANILISNNSTMASLFVNASSISVHV